MAVDFRPNSNPLVDGEGRLFNVVRPRGLAEPRLRKIAVTGDTGFGDVVEFPIGIGYRRARTSGKQCPGLVMGRAQSVSPEAGTFGESIGSGADGHALICPFQYSTLADCLASPAASWKAATSISN